MIETICKWHLKQIEFSFQIDADVSHVCCHKEVHVITKYFTYCVNIITDYIIIIKHPSVWGTLLGTMQNALI